MLITNNVLLVSGSLVSSKSADVEEEFSIPIKLKEENEGYNTVTLYIKTV